MTYTLKSARYANEDHSSAIIDTEEDGHVAISAVDTPEHWKHLHESGMEIAPHEGPTLDQLKQAALNQLEKDAQKVRDKIVTPGMSDVYAAKKAEAIECLDDPDPKRVRYPLVAASIGSDVKQTGDEFTDLKNAAAFIVDRANTCRHLLGDVESLRLWGKRAIEVCQSKDELDAVLGQIRWPA